MLTLLIVVVLLLLWGSFRENFATREEKASKIREWFRWTINPTFASFRREFPESNIVEYEGVRLSDKSMSSIMKIVT